MDLSYKQEVTVGSLVILAIVLFIVGTTWLNGRSVGADSDEWWKIQFKDAGNLKTSSPVKISGVAVGKVERIRLLDPGKVLVEVSLPEKITPRVDAGAQIVAVGFVGDAAVQLDPGEAPEKLSHDRVIIGSQAAGLTDMAASLGDRADSVLIGAQAIVNQKTADQLYATMSALQGTLKVAQRTMEIYGDGSKGPTAQLTRTLATLRADDRTARQHPRQSGPRGRPHPQRLAHRQPVRHDDAVELDRGPSRHRAAQDQTRARARSASSPPTRVLQRPAGGDPVAEEPARRAAAASGEGAVTVKIF